MNELFIRSLCKATFFIIIRQLLQAFCFTSSHLLFRGPQQVTWPAQTTKGLGFRQTGTNQSISEFGLPHTSVFRSLASRMDTGELYVNVSWWNSKLFMIKMKMQQLSNENKIDYLQRNEVKVTAFSSAVLAPRSLKWCFQRLEKQLL